MHIVRYIFKQLAAYIGCVVILMIAMQFIKSLFDIPFNALRDNMFMAVIFFAYPIYRVVRSTIDAVWVFFDKTPLDSKQQKFVGAFHVLTANFWQNKMYRAFAINMLLKFLQLTALISMVYAFISNDFRVLKPVVVVAAVVGLLFALTLVRSQKFEYEARNNEQLQKLEKIRQTPGGMSINSERIKVFMNFPRMAFIIDLIIVIIGIFISFIASKIPFSITSSVIFDIKIIGLLAGIFLPFTGIYLFYQNWRSRMYTLRLGKGDYGQEKIEFFIYSGSGDEMEDTRYIIDRVESFEVGSRYIKVQKPALMKTVKIPRTMSIEEERKLLELIARMRYPVNKSLTKSGNTGFTNDKEMRGL